MRTWRCVNCTYTPLNAGTHHCPRCQWTVFEPVDGDGRDHAAADQAHRDDLARDVARLWVAADKHDSRDLTAALDRLAAAYGTGEPT